MSHWGQVFSKRQIALIFFFDSTPLQIFLQSIFHCLLYFIHLCKFEMQMHAIAVGSLSFPSPFLPVIGPSNPAKLNHFNSCKKWNGNQKCITKNKNWRNKPHRPTLWYLINRSAKACIYSYIQPGYWQQDKMGNIWKTACMLRLLITEIFLTNII